MTEFGGTQRAAAQAAAEAGDAEQAARILAHMQREGCTAAEVSLAAEAVAELLAPRVADLFRDEEAEWLAASGISTGQEESSGPAAYEQPPAFDDPEDEELYGGVQRIWDDVVRRREEQSTYGAYRVATEMLARGEITGDDRDTMLDSAVDEKYEERPWGRWIDRARHRLAAERQGGREAEAG